MGDGGVGMGVGLAQQQAAMLNGMHGRELVLLLCVCWGGGCMLTAATDDGACPARPAPPTNETHRPQS